MKLLGRVFFVLLVIFISLNATDNYIKTSTTDKLIYISKPFIVSTRFKYKIDSNIKNIEIFSPKIEAFKILKKSKFHL